MFKPRNQYFYFYQIADILFTGSCRAIGILLAWIMINIEQLHAQFGWLVTLSWLSQVLVLVGLSFVADRLNSKITLHLCSALGLVSMLFLQLGERVSTAKLAVVFLITSVLSIVIQPIGSSIVPTLYKGQHVQAGFRIRGLVNSLNMVMGAVISGFIIQAFSPEQTILILSCSMTVAVLIWRQMKIKEIQNTQNESPVTYSALTAIRALLLNQLERMLVLISALANFILTPTLMYLTPILVLAYYQRTALELGIAEGMFGMGMLLGSVLVLGLKSRLSVRYSSVLSLNLVAVGLALIFAFHQIEWLYVGLAMTGVGAVIFNINTTKIRCSATPEKLRNAFESIFLAVCLIPIPFGIAFATLMVESNHLNLILGCFAALIFAASVILFFSKKFKYVSALSDAELLECYPKIFVDAYVGRGK